MERTSISPQHTTTGHNLRSNLKDPGSAITHMIGMILAIIFSVPMIQKAILLADTKATVSVVVFCLSLFLLYFASTAYHSCLTTKTLDRRLKKFDHMMIYVLIAGTYTPVCVYTLQPQFGLPLLAAIWGIALFGMIAAGIWIYTPKWLNSTIYIVMGWLIILAGKPLLSTISYEGFAWLLAGGIIYTIGGVIYALKLHIFDRLPASFGNHEIFHLFVMAGSICHYIFIYSYVLA